MDFRESPVLVRGGGEIASAAARLLFLCGFPVVVLEREAPLAVRRRVCFAEAVSSGEATVEGVVGRRLALAALAEALPAAFVTVVVDPRGESIPRLRPRVLVDGRMAKRNLGTRRDQAPFVIGLGPGFAAGEDVHAVVETQRGSGMGRVIWSGAAEADTGRPGEVMGIGEERVLRAPRAGVFQASCRIGDVLPAQAKVGEVGGAPVTARVGGLVRGLLADGVVVEAGLKVGDIDPRGRAADPARVSDKGRAVAAGVLEAVMVHFGGRV